MNRLIVVAVATFALWALGLQQAAYACYVGFTPYPDSNRVNDGQQFVFGQVSQGGNYYSGAYGGIGYTIPAPPPATDSTNPQEHVNAFLGSQVSPAGSGCCWAFAGWHIGYNHYNGVTTTTPTSYAELSDTISYVFTVGDPAAQSSGSQWYQTVQNGQLPSGRYRYDAYWYSGGLWKWGGYSELLTAGTETVAAGEATNPVSPPLQRSQCRRLSASGQDDRMQSLQMYVGGIGWQYWRPSPEGRWADIVYNVTPLPYHRTAIIDFTDQGVGGP